MERVSIDEKEKEKSIGVERMAKICNILYIYYIYKAHNKNKD